MQWYLKVLRNYANFEGRARRKEFWFFVLFNIIISFGFAIIDLILGTRSPNGEGGLFQGLYALAVIIPAFAVGARRLHDTNRSGWWQLIMLIPIVGIIVLIIFWATDGEEGDNRFGSDPKLEPEPGSER